MPKLRNGNKGDSNPGSLDCESGVLPLSHRAPKFNLDYIRIMCDRRITVELKLRQHTINLSMSSFCLVDIIFLLQLNTFLLSPLR